MLIRGIRIVCAQCLQGLARLCRFVPHYHRETHGEAQHLGKESCHYRNHRLYVGLCSDKTGTLTLGKMVNVY